MMNSDSAISLELDDKLDIEFVVSTLDAIGL